MFNFKNCQKCSLGKCRKPGRQPLEGIISPFTDFLFIDDTVTSEQEITEKIGISLRYKIIVMMVLEASRKAKKVAPIFSYTNMTLCRACDSVAESTRVPTQEEILKCKPNIIKIYKKVQPKHTFFLSELVEDNYKKVFTDYTTLVNPWLLIERGGSTSPQYLSELRKIMEVIECLK